MRSPNAQLKALEDHVLQCIQSVDLNTPMTQLDAVFAALIEVPTGIRRSDTDFTHQAAVALDMLAERARRLSTRAQTLSDHVRPVARLQAVMH